MKFYIKVLSLSFFSILFIHFLHAQNYVNVVDKVGFTYQNPLVEQKANQAVQNTPITGSGTFKIYSYSLYPIMGCVKGDCGIEEARERALFDLGTKGYSIGIIKEFLNSSDPSSNNSSWAVRFTIRINLPSEDPLYDEVDEVEKTALQSIVQSQFEETYKNNSGFDLATLISRCEIEGIETYIKQLNNLRSGGMIENALEIAGYNKIDISGYQFRIAEPTGLHGTKSERSENGTEIEFKTLNSNSWGLFSDCFRNGQITVRGKLFKYFVYTNTFFDLIPTTESEFRDKFNNSNAEIGIHFYWTVNNGPRLISGQSFPSGTELGYKIIYKINKTKADEVVQLLFDSNLQKAYNEQAAKTDIHSDSRFMPGPTWAQWGYNTLSTESSPSTYRAIGYGIIDGFLATLVSFWEMGDYALRKFECESSQNDAEIEKIILLSVFQTSMGIGEDDSEFKKFRSTIIDLYNEIIINKGYKNLLINIKDSILETFDNELALITSGTKEGYYQVGKLLFEVIYEFSSTFATGGASLVKSIPKMLKGFKDAIASNGKNFSAFIKGCLEKVKGAGGKFPDPNTAKKWFKCKILGKGCFVKDTPILMARSANQFSLRHSVAAYAMAALPLISPVPIQEVQLLDYAVAHKTVNSSYGLTANASDTYVIGKDPYTSDEQRVRDHYEINATDWHEVSFKEVNGISSCKLALHQDWIERHDYMVDGIVNMNLPEQGISGPFKITSIRHIQPQKIPVDEDPEDDYEYRPVTGLFTHQSNDVYTIGFTNAPSLGVTATHPIYSTTYHDWRLAGELEVGERVLTFKGEATVSSTEKRAGSETVYNLEVKDLHNFLVGDEGVVVHNGCANEIEKYVTNVIGKTWKMKKPSVLKAGTKAGCAKCVKYADHNGKRVYFDDDDFPVFDEFAPKGNLNNQVIKYTSPDLQGYSTDVPSGADINFADTWFNSVKAQFGNNITYQGNNFYVNGVKHTWHHHQDGVTMFLVPSDVHSIAHTGGGAMIKYGLKGAFQGPKI